MDALINAIKDLVSNVGFPILAFLLMYKQNKDLSATIGENTKAINDLREKIVDNQQEKADVKNLPLNFIKKEV